MIHEEGELRKRLQKAHPELAAALTRSWDIAANEWLPSLGVEGGGGYLHVRNMERHLERLLLAGERAAGNDRLEFLQPAECYVLLCSILFHVFEERRLGGQGGLQAKYAELGIPNRQLADVISTICRCHLVGGPRGVGAAPAFDSLSVRGIDPFGRIREHSCAAFLALVDAMDQSFRGIPPAYHTEDRELGVAAQARRHTGDVLVDLEGRTVKVILGSEGEHPEWFPDDEPKLAELDGVLTAAELNGGSTDGKRGATDLTIYESLRSTGETLCSGKAMLDVVSPYLSASGIALHGWLLEYRQALFRYTRSGHPRWHETHEPALSMSYLKRVVDAMWDLSTQIFGQGFFSYATLSDALREPQIGRVQRAVARLAIIAHRLNDGPRIWTGHSQWRWVPGVDGHPKERARRTVLLERLEQIRTSAAD